jgi:hypothetical protein
VSSARHTLNADRVVVGGDKVNVANGRKVTKVDIGPRIVSLRCRNSFCEIDMKFLLLFIFASFPVAAMAQSRVSVDLSTMPKIGTPAAFRAGMGIRGINLGMSIDEARAALTAQGFTIADQRLVTFERVFEKNGIRAIGSTPNFIGRIIAGKESATVKETITLITTSPLTSQRVYLIINNVNYVGNTLQINDVIPGMAEKWGEPSLNFRAESAGAIRYISWYFGKNGAPQASFQQCREMPAHARSIQLNYNMTHSDGMDNSFRFLQQNCGGVIAAELRVGLDRVEKVNGFTVVLYDNVSRTSAYTPDYQALSAAFDPKTFLRPEIDKPKF